MSQPPGYGYGAVPGVGPIGGGGGPVYSGAATQGTLVSDVLAQADSAAQAADSAPGKVPVLLSHLVAAVVAVSVVGVNSAVWALVPGGLAAVLTVVQLLALVGFQAVAARWAHDRSRPV